MMSTHEEQAGEECETVPVPRGPLTLADLLQAMVWRGQLMVIQRAREVLAGSPSPTSH